MIQRFKQRLTTGLMALSMVVSQVLAPVATVSADAPGNNGTLKVHEKGTLSGSESNDPKVCIFNFEAFGLDANQTGNITIETQSGTPVITPVIVELETDQSGNGETEYINDTDSAITLAEGHYKATLDKKFGTDPGDKAKSKVFKVECTSTPQPVDVCPNIEGNQATVPANMYKDNSGNCVANPVPEVAVCPAELPVSHSTNLSMNGWSVVGDAEYVEDGIKLNVSGGWESSYISRAMVGPLADIGSEVDFDAAPEQYVGIHIVTDKGTLVYEKEATYDGKWWSTSDFGVASGMGYATFDTLENIVAANPGVMTSELRVLYTHPGVSSAVITSVTVGCTEYTFDKEVTQVTVCPEGNLPLIRSTNADTNGWTVPEDAEYLPADGGIKLNVSGGWESSYISRAMVGPLADIGSEVDFDAAPEQYVGIHIVTDKGTLVYEKEATYDGKWWSTSDFGVASGMGYATFDTLENIVAANPDVNTSVLYVLYTHPNASSTIISSVTVGCTEYVFSKVGGSGGGGEEPEVPVTPVTPTTPVTPSTPVVPAGGQGSVLPAELPLTGTNGSILSTWIALLAAVLTYGAVYYLQPKKRFEQ